MKIIPLLIESTGNEFNANYIVSSWLKEIINFQQCYKQLDSRVCELVFEQSVVKSDLTYSGQCPVGVLTSLRGTMKSELTTLLQDMERGDTLNESVDNLKKIKVHTRLLKQLNQQAQTIIYLTALSAS